MQRDTQSETSLFASVLIAFAVTVPAVLTLGCASNPGAQNLQTPNRQASADTLVRSESKAKDPAFTPVSFLQNSSTAESLPADDWKPADSLMSELEDALSLMDDHNHGANASSLGSASLGSASLGSIDQLHDVIALPRNATQLPDNFHDLTESEMLSIAISSSPVLRPLGVRVLEAPESITTMLDPAISGSDPFFGPDAALAAFDSQLSASLNSQNNDRVFNNAILGGAVQELTQDFSTLNTGLQKQTLSGATINLNTLNQYDSNNRAGNRFRSAWDTQYEASVRQPLLQGAGRDFNLIAGPNASPGFNFSRGIVIAQLNVKVTEADFEIEVRNFVQDLYTTYWGLQQQYANVENIGVAKDLAYQTWQSILARRDARLTGGEANKEAQARARYYGFVRQLQTALGGSGTGQDGLYASERELRRMIGMPIVDHQLLRPVDDAPQVEFTFDFDDLSSQAIGNRIELTRQSIRVQQEEKKLIASKNFLLPQLDLIGRYRLRGFGDDLTGDGPRFASAYQDLFSFDHQEWEFGIEMGVTAGRRQAHAAVRNGSLQVRRERSVLLEQQRTVRHQVANAHAEVASSFAALEASMAQVDAASERLEASEVQFKADKIQIEFLLDAQEELLRAQTQLAADMSRYAISLVNIGTMGGSLLENVGIHIHRSGYGNQLFYAGQ